MTTDTTEKGLETLIMRHLTVSKPPTYSAQMAGDRCMGSFRLVAGIRRLHRNHKFAGQIVKTVVRSLRHSCRPELTRQGVSLGLEALKKFKPRMDADKRRLRTQSLSAFIGVHPRLIPFLLTFQYRVGVVGLVLLLGLRSVASSARSAGYFKGGY